MLGRAWGLDLRQVCENGKWGKDAIVGNGIDGLHYVNTKRRLPEHTNKEMIDAIRFPSQQKRTVKFDFTRIRPQPR